MWFLIHTCPTDTFFNERGSLFLDRLDLEMETDEREDQALEILDQVVETPTIKSMKNNIPATISNKFFPGLRIRINLSCWIRIRIQEGKNDPQKKKKVKKYSCSELLDVLF
jgi:hypothetical protein